MTYSYKCNKCSYRFDWHNVLMEERDTFKPPCPQCNSEDVKRVMPDKMFFTVNENNDPISAKPDSYWTNAEQNRIKKRKKQMDEKKEKEFYDKEVKERKRQKAEREAKLAKEGGGFEVVK